ncbi:hypothetical protein C5167_019319 [Papaver somniferum]|uniref:Uncharacterized protein n=1 Tax=Papaver somniferum TaxID=3469 RepID=A0A4Y7IPU8_PAPSO|nr:hypothetical protein C5167_019319 [Papaver somniferum]
MVHGLQYRCYPVASIAKERQLLKMALRAVGRLVSQRLSQGASRNFCSNAVPSKNAQVKSMEHQGSNEILEELDEVTRDCMHHNGG